MAPVLERLARVGAIAQVRTEQPSLEDVFLAIVGHDRGAAAPTATGRAADGSTTHELTTKDAR